MEVVAEAVVAVVEEVKSRKPPTLENLVLTVKNYTSNCVVFVAKLGNLKGIFPFSRLNFKMKPINSKSRALVFAVVAIIGLKSSLPAWAQATPSNLQLLDQAIEKSGGSEEVVIDDMIFPRERFVAYRNQVAGQRTGGTRSAFYNVPRWTGGNVPYVLDAALPTAQRTAFIEACREWEKYVNVRFMPRTTQANYIRVYQDGGGGSFSYVGMNGGAQDMSLASWATKWTAAHEIEHALGAMHEQCRSDRGTYVSINFANIDPDAASNFAIISDSINRGAYDFDSVMHYYDTAFAIDPSIYTIIAKPAYAAFQNSMGQRDHLSALDKAGMVYIYGAPPVYYPLGGTVTSGGSALSGVSLALSNGQKATTNTSGVFNFPSVAKGTYTLTPSKAGFSFSPVSRSVSLTAGITNANFSATPVVVPVSNATVSVSSVSMVEGNAGAPYMTFNVSLSQPVTQTVTVNYTTFDGTAKAGTDYTLRRGTLTFRAGTTTADVRIALLPDRVVEASEGFSVVLSTPAGATLGTATGRGTIVNDDRSSDVEAPSSDAGEASGSNG